MAVPQQETLLQASACDLYMYRSSSITFFTSSADRILCPFLMAFILGRDSNWKRLDVE